MTEMGSVVFCKPVKKTVANKETGEKDESRYFMLRSFTVFSADQVSGEAVEKLKAAPVVQPADIGSPSSKVAQ